jgi:hypothetical protein
MFDGVLKEADVDTFYQECWGPVAELFREDRASARTVDKALNFLLNQETNSRPILVIDLSREQAQGLLWNDHIQALVIKRLLDGLSWNAERAYREGQSLNTLVVIDEAHRLAARELSREDSASRSVRSALVDAARTTRSMGLGGCSSARRYQVWTERFCNRFASSSSVSG